MDRSPTDPTGSASLFAPILDNRSDGATALFKQFVQLAKGQSHETVLHGLRHCRNTFPLMAVWPYALVRLEEGKQDLTQLAAHMARQTQATIAQATAALKDNQVVLTLSNSSLVRETLIRWWTNAQDPREVRCLISRPGEEGRHLAAALQQAGCHAALVEDHDLSETMAGVQAVAMGADMYDRWGFVNKIGSSEVVRTAGALGKPVLVLAEKFKEVPRIPELTPARAGLTLQPGNEMRREIIFELTPWQPHVRLVSH